MPSHGGPSLAALVDKYRDQILNVPTFLRGIQALHAEWSGGNGYCRLCALRSRGEHRRLVDAVIVIDNFAVPGRRMGVCEGHAIRAAKWEAFNRQGR